MKLHTKTLLASLTACSAVVGSADAANIMFVGDGDPSDLSAFLANNGHTVTEFDSGTYGWNLGSNNGVDYAESFDLVVIGRGANFSGIRGNGATWNALSVPMINTNMYLVSGQFGAASFQWGTGGGIAANGSTTDPFTVGDASDPIFDGVALTAGDTLTPALYDSGTRLWDLNGNSPQPGVTPLAIDTDDSDLILLAYAAPDSLRPGGAAQYFIPGVGGGGDEEIFTAQGEQVFLNAVNTLIPEPSSLALLGLGGLLVARRRRG